MISALVSILFVIACLHANALVFRQCKKDEEMIAKIEYKAARTYR